QLGTMLIVNQLVDNILEGTYYDYLELYIQFGYVFLFLSIFPMAPIIAFCNNCVEIRSDSLKLCFGHKRPHQRSAKSISGSWMKAFEVMGIISVMTNCALLTYHIRTDSGNIICSARYAQTGERGSNETKV
ncbi:unnamed protein product, partial [Oppiella nova]